MIIVPFEPKHLQHLPLQTMQKHHAEDLRNFAVYGKQLRSGLSYTIIDNGNIALCAGVLDKWSGVGSGWFLFSALFRTECFLPVHRHTMRFIRIMLQERYHRIEITVAPGHEEGHRWAKALRFEEEGLMRKYDPKGRDAFMYARTRE